MEMDDIIQDRINKDGWALIQEIRENDIFLKYQTKGLVETQNHKNLEITLSRDMTDIYKILDFVISTIKEGYSYVEGEIYDNLLEGQFVKFVEKTYTENEIYQEGETLLRMIISDEDGNFPGDPGCAPEYLLQEKDLYFLHGIHIRNDQIIGIFN